jgi:hypothetical protein
MRLRSASGLTAAALLLLLGAAPASARQGPVEETVGKRLTLAPMPIFFYTPETDFAFGAAVQFTRRDLAHQGGRPSVILPVFIYTLKKQTIAQLNLDLYLARDVWHLTTCLTYTRFPNSFFGIGNDTREEDEEYFTRRSRSIQLDLERLIRPHLYVGLRTEYDDYRIGDTESGGLLDTGTIRGSGGGIVAGAGFMLTWDSRDDLFYPVRGVYARYSNRWYGPSSGSDFAFRDEGLDLRGYLPAPGGGALAGQVRVNLTSGDVPFHRLSNIGGANVLRGYFEGMYRDRAMAAVQLEYRRPLFGRWGCAIFAGAGEVAPRIGDLTLGELKPAGGFGLRWQFDPREKVNLRLDLGYGRGFSGMYITVSEAF